MNSILDSIACDLAEKMVICLDEDLNQVIEDNPDGVRVAIERHFRFHRNRVQGKYTIYTLNPDDYDNMAFSAMRIQKRWPRVIVSYLPDVAVLKDEL